jgi:glycine/D-amino acid oxidase-like deaminating enzyme
MATDELPGSEGMTDFPSTARVLIIGAGAVGASCLYHLAKTGWTERVPMLIPTAGPWRRKIAKHAR